MYQNSRTDPRMKRRDKSDAPAETRGDLARRIPTLKENDKSTFFSPSEVWCLPAPSVTKPEERAFVVDSGASMHMLSRNDLYAAELETVRVSKSPTTGVCQRIGHNRDAEVS